MCQHIMVTDVAHQHEIIQTIEVVFAGIEPKLFIVKTKEDIDWG